jgi:PAS domain S-box-containing protein
LNQIPIIYQPIFRKKLLSFIFGYINNFSYFAINFSANYPFYFAAMNKTKQIFFGHEQLNILMNNLPGMAYRCLDAPQWTMKYVSDGCKKLTGYNANDFIDNRKISYEQIIHEDDRQKVWESVQEAIRLKTHFEIEYRIITKNKQEKWVWEKGVAIINKTGHIDHIEGFITDITEKKQSEKNIKLINETVIPASRMDNVKEICEYVGKSVHQLIPHCYIVISWYDFKLDAIRIYSYTGFRGFVKRVIDIIGKDPRKMTFDPDNMGKEKKLFFSGKLEEVGLYELLQEKVSHNKLRTFKNIMNVDKIYTVGFALEERPQGGITFLMHKGHDIENISVIETIASHISLVLHREQANRALKQNEEKFRNLYETMAQGVVYQDKNGEIISANPAALDILGLTEDQIKKRSSMHPDWKAVDEHKNTLPGDKHPAMLALKTGKTIRNFTQGIYNPNLKDYVWIIVNAIPQFLPGSKKPYQVYSTFLNITERKKAQDQLIDLNKKLAAQNDEYESLNEALRQTNEELYRAKEKAEESNTLKSAFLANISHEIRTPMNGIMGFAELLRNPSLTGEKQADFVNVIKQSGNRMLNIINDLIDISRIEAGQVELKVENTNINHIIDDLYSFFLPETEEKSLLLSSKKELPDEKSIIQTDKTKLNQILSNLIKNAVKYTNKGSINFGYKKKKGTLIFFIADTGIGISADFKDVIFDRFRQAELSISGAYEGAGLGLSICRAYIEMLGGEVWLKSEQDKGSTFYFSVPYNPPPKKEMNIISSVINKQYTNIAGLKILVVEDDSTSFLLIEEIIGIYDVKLIHAKDGQEAVNIVQSDPSVDLVLMDIKLPVMDGYEATKEIKKIRPDLPIIAQTAFAFKHDKQKASNAGCNDYISKPIKPEELLNKISSLLE